jgi:hypothetical protein
MERKMYNLKVGMIIQTPDANIKYEIIEVREPNGDEFKVKASDGTEAWISLKVISSYLDKGYGFIVKELPTSRLSDVE